MSESAPAQNYGYQAAQQQQAPYNVLGIVSFVLSVLGFTIVAVILGHISMSQIKRTGERGRGFAIAGLVIGYVTLAIGILFIIVIVGAGLLAASTSSNY